MPPADRASALVIFNLGGTSTAPPKVESSDDATQRWAVFGEPFSAERTTTKLSCRSKPRQIAEVVLPLRPRPKSKAARQLLKVEELESNLITSRGEHLVKQEPVDLNFPADSQVLVDVLEEASDEQIRDALAHLKNPSAKTKKSTAMPDRILFNRLKVIGFDTYPIEESVNLYFPFSRYFFSNRFGGSFVDAFPAPSEKKLREHGIDDWAFLSLLYHPHVPQVPGAPGLFYATADADGESFNKRVFYRLDDDKWIYVGQYRFSVAQSLTIPEYRSLSPKVKDTWMGRVAEAPDWALIILARTYLRSRRGIQEPTDDEAYELMKKSPAVLKTVTQEQVAQGYENGKERIGVYAMRCIRYDSEWLAGLIEDYPAWKKERAETLRLRKQKAKQVKTEKDGPKKRRNLKRKASPEDTESSLSDGSYESGVGSDTTELPDDDTD